MTALRDFLDDFTTVSPAVTDVQVFSDDDLEGYRLESFENGYRAGWDDAVKAQADDRTRIASGFGQHLQDLSFTYHEAYTQVMNAMTPLLEEITGVLLPGMARAALGPHVLDQLQTHASEIGTLDVIVAVSPGNTDAVAPLLEGAFSFPVRLEADTTLSDEQADIRFGQTEKQIDIGALLTSVTEALDGFAHDNQRKLANG